MSNEPSVTPLHLEMLLFYYMRRPKIGVPCVGATVASCERAKRELVSWDMIAEDPLAAEEFPGTKPYYKLTDRGFAWLKILRQAPMPELETRSVWVHPITREEL